MSNKKPAHEVMLEAIGEAIKALNRDNSVNDFFMIATHTGILSTELELLKRMIIPEKHLDEVIDTLHQIRSECSLDNIDRILTDELFLAIATSEKTNGV